MEWEKSNLLLSLFTDLPFLSSEHIRGNNFDHFYGVTTVNELIDKVQDNNKHWRLYKFFVWFDFD